MTTRTVTTQAELNKAIAEEVDFVEIRSPAGVWLEVTACDSSNVTAYDSSNVRAYDSSNVRAYGSSNVRAYDSSNVRAYGSSNVRAYDSSNVRAYGSSNVRAYDSSNVMACDSSNVTACDSSNVTAYDSSNVTACDSSNVTAYDSSNVTACDSSNVRAYGSSNVRATAHVSVHLHHSTVHLTGGTVIDHTGVDDFTAAEWCAYHGVNVSRGIATVFKAVNDKWTTDRGFDYAPGAKPSAPDWSNTNDCGGGLHFGPTPIHALAYFSDATKFVAVGVRLSELRPITGGAPKCKAPKVVRACVEVDINGKEIAA